MKGEDPVKMQAGRVAGLAAVGLLIIGLTACGDDGESDGGGESEAAEADEATGEEGDGSGEEAADESDDREGHAGDSCEAETTTTTAVDTEEAVLAAWERADEAFLSAQNPPDVDHPDLLATHTGSALENAREGIQDAIDGGYGVVEVSSNESVEVAEVGSSSARLLICWNQELQAVDLESGDNRGGPQFFEGYSEAELQLSDGEWSLTTWVGLESECEIS